MEMLTFNRHIYQSADRSSERRLGAGWLLTRVGEIDFLTNAYTQSDEKITEMKKIALMVKSVIALITINPELPTNKRLSPIRVANTRNSLTYTNKR